MYFSDDIKAMLNVMTEGILVIDATSKIIYANDAYLQFVSKDSGIHTSHIIGNNLKTLRPGAQLPEVVRTGKPLLRQQRREAGDVYFVNMYPIISRDEVLGGLSVVTFIDDAAAMKEQFAALDRMSKQLITRVGSATAKLTFDDIVAKGKKSVACKEYAKKISDTMFPILITGENGVGKSVYAQAIHNASPMGKGAFIKADCMMLASRLDNEIFGVETGSSGGSIGLLEAAKGGTLFIDEISEMPVDIQVKLLETLQTESFSRVGGAYTLPLEARIIAASNVSLEDKVAEGKFSAELYYLLKVFSINVPPLRERMDDVPVIVKQQLEKVRGRLKKPIGITDAAMNRLLTHKWPGNVRELEHVLEFSSYLAKHDMIAEESLPENIGIAQSESEMTLVERVRAFEKNEILKTLEFYGNDLQGKKLAAEKLGISLASLYSKLK